MAPSLKFSTISRSNYRNRIHSAVVIIIFFIVLFGCNTSPTHNPAIENDSKSWLADNRTSLSVTILSYNVAGLPELFSSSHPSVNHVLISPKLNYFDIVLVQEDFWYHKDLSSEVVLPYASLPTRKGLLGMGDGLNRFAAYSFEDFSRHTWKESHGIFSHSGDGLVPKGFTAATHHFSRHISVDIYNLHMDAGGSQKDYLAREIQIDQLAKIITERSGDSAVIVAGDWNLKETRADDSGLLARFKESLSLRDVREVLSVGQDRIDRILYRSEADVEIAPQSYQVESDLFRSTDGRPLSDHDAISVKFFIRAPPANAVPKSID